MFIRIIFFLILIIFTSCSKDAPIYEAPKNINAFNVYKEGLAAFEDNELFFASKKFSEAELNFENIDYAAKSAIMASFSLYGINFYDEAKENLERYLTKYPADKNVIYAHYLIALIHYEQISDETKDLLPLIEAKKKIEFFLKKYPKTEYATDLRFKKELIESQFAAKELYLAKYYISVQKWIPAINRLKIILEKHSETIFIEEALHRLVEIHYHIGLVEEAQKYANILGYNYNSSEWYQQSFKVFNKNYKISKNLENKNNKKSKSFLTRIINLIK